MKTITFQSFSSLVFVYCMLLAIVAFNTTPIFAAPTNSVSLKPETDESTANIDKKGLAPQQLSSTAVHSSKMTTALVSTDSTPSGSSAPSSTVANATQLATNSLASVTKSNATYQSTVAPSPAKDSSTSMESTGPITSPVATSTTAAPSSSKGPKSGDGSTAPHDTGAKQPIDLSSGASSSTVAANDSKTPMVSSAPTTAATTSIAKSPSTEQKPEAPGGFKDDKDKDPAGPKPDFDSTANKDTGVKQPVNLNGEPIVNYRHKGSGSSETDSGSSHFMAYLLVAIFLFGFLYVLYHKKQKIMRTIVGFIVEGRRSGTVRRTSGSGGGSGSGSTGNYKLLPTDEFGSGNRDSDSSRTIVY